MFQKLRIFVMQVQLEKQGDENLWLYLETSSLHLFDEYLLQIRFLKRGWRYGLTNK